MKDKGKAASLLRSLQYEYENGERNYEIDAVDEELYMHRGVKERAKVLKPEETVKWLVQAHIDNNGNHVSR